MGKILPILLAVLGIAGGIGAGIVLVPSTEMADDTVECTPTEHENSLAQPVSLPEEPKDTEFVRMSNQFVVPIVGEERIKSLIVMSLSLEVTAGTTELAFAREPKIRDEFLRVLFDYANIGGFDGTFTDVGRLNRLREKLSDAAIRIIGDSMQNVLITEIARQDSR